MDREEFNKLRIDSTVRNTKLVMEGKVTGFGTQSWLYGAVYGVAMPLAGNGAYVCYSDRQKSEFVQMKYLELISR